MPQYTVSTVKQQGVRVNSFVEAKDEKEAVAIFRNNFRLKAYEDARNVTLDIQVACLEPSGSSVAVDDKSVAEVVAELKADKAKGVKEAAAVVAEPVPVEPLADLKRFGVSDEHIAALVAAGLTTPDDIVAYAKSHHGLGSIGGITPADAGQIATAVKAAKAN